MLIVKSQIGADRLFKLLHLFLIQIVIANRHIQYRLRLCQRPVQVVTANDHQHSDHNDRLQIIIFKKLELALTVQFFVLCFVICVIPLLIDQPVLFHLALFILYGIIKNSCHICPCTFRCFIRLCCNMQSYRCSVQISLSTI